MTMVAMMAFLGNHVVPAALDNANDVSDIRVKLVCNATLGIMVTFANITANLVGRPGVIRMECVTSDLIIVMVELFAGRHVSRIAVCAPTLERAVSASQTMWATVAKSFVRTALEHAHQLAVSMAADVGILVRFVRISAAASARKPVATMEACPGTCATVWMELVLKVAKMAILGNGASTGVIRIAN